MRDVRILWTDDEIDLLQPHILFLEEKGYLVSTATNGDDALEKVESEEFDIIFLDENMPGKSGLETLSGIKKINPDIPVIMITKSEEENIMDEAIGSKISDYLIKPVNPRQVLLSIKKYVDTKRLVSEKTIADYQQAFGKLGQEINMADKFEDWVDIYRRLVYWQLEMTEQEETGMDEILQMQFSDANSEFGKFIAKNYKKWISGEEEAPLMSHQLMREKVFPLLAEEENIFLLLIDNFRYDQWRTIHSLITELYTVEEDLLYCSILPTATQYARNAIFSGLMPSDIAKKYPDLWLHDEESGGKNLKERELFLEHLKILKKDVFSFYAKINQQKEGMKILDKLPDLLSKQMVILIFNYIDMLSHARTEMDMIKELAKDEAAYRSLTLSWFKHSPLYALLKELQDKNVKIVLTTDHGTVRVRNPQKVIGDRNTSTNLRYKNGKDLNYKDNQAFAFNNPEEIKLPRTHVSTSYIFAKNYDYFVYPKNYNYYVNYYKDTFQHGGISMEEMLVPFIVLSPKEK